MTASDNNRRQLANAVGVEESDALDQWLESTNGTSGRDADLVSARALSNRSTRSDNGLAGGAGSLASVAQRAHASIAAAEQKSGPPVPVYAIWEEIMASAIVQDAHVRRGRPRVDPFHTAEGPRQRIARPIPAWLSGSHWAVSAVLITALVVGILALYQSFAGSPGGPGDDPTINPGLAAGTPGSTTPIDTTANLAPISPEECDVEPRSLEEVSALMQDPGEFPPREYGPIQPASEEVALEVSDAQRVYESCRRFGDTAHRRAMDSPRLISEGMGLQGYDSIARNSATFDEYIETTRALSELLLTDDRNTVVFSDRDAPIDENGEFDLSDFYWALILPEHVVELGDGRIGGPLSTVYAANSRDIGLANVEDGRQTPVPPDYELFDYSIYIQDPTRNDRWVLDETLRLCASDCDCEAWYAVAEPYYQSHVPIQPRVFDATPTATPSADAAWMLPIMAEECVTEPLSDEEIAALVSDSGDAAEASHQPAGAVEPDLANEVAAADRAWQSCFVFGSAGERAALQSPQFTREGPGLDPQNLTSEQQVLDFIAGVNASQELADAIFSGDPTDYYVESDPDVEVDMNALPDGIMTLPRPDLAMYLADGRIAIPIVTLLPPGVEGEVWVGEGSFWLIEAHIVARDETRDGRWVIDERIYLCMGDCSQFPTNVNEWFGIDTVEPTPEATPAATPQAITPYRNL